MDRPGYSHSVQQMLTFTLQTLTGVNSSLADVPVCSLARFVSADGDTKSRLLIQTWRRGKSNYKLNINIVSIFKCTDLNKQ